MKKGLFVIEDFDGVQKFLGTIGNRTANTVFAGHSLSSNEEGRSFTLTSSYKESEELMASGYAEGLKDLKKSKGCKIQTASNSVKSIPHTSVVGFVPNIPNAIMGRPDTMISTERVKMKSKIVRIMYDCGAACSVEAQKFVTAGKNLLDLIIMLELQGYRVHLDVCLIYAEKKQKGFCRIKVKDYRQAINPLKISYPLLHPSFFRRQGFRWLETCPEITEKNFSSGYGYPLRNCNPNGKSTDACRSFLKSEGLLPDGYFFTNMYEAVDLSGEELAKAKRIKK